MLSGVSASMLVMNLSSPNVPSRVDIDQFHILLAAHRDVLFGGGGVGVVAVKGGGNPGRFERRGRVSTFPMYGES